MTGSFRIVGGTVIRGADNTKTTTTSTTCARMADDGLRCNDQLDCTTKSTVVTNRTGKWSYDEDAALRAIVSSMGPTKWNRIASKVSGRSSKQCRERWKNHIDPEIYNGPWTPEEDRFIHDCFLDHGPSWAAFASLLPGRTDNAVKNRFQSHIFRCIAPLAPIDHKRKHTVVRFRKKSFAPQSPNVSQSHKRKIASPHTDTNTARAKKLKRTYDNIITRTNTDTIPVERVAFDYLEHTGFSDDTIGVASEELGDVGEVLEKCTSIESLCLADAIACCETDKRDAKTESNIGEALCVHSELKSTECDEEEEAEWNIMSLIAGFTPQNETNKETNKCNGNFTKRIVRAMPKMPKDRKRFIVTPFDSAKEAQWTTDNPSLEFVNTMLMKQKHTSETPPQ